MTGQRNVRIEATTPASGDAVWRLLADPYSYAQWVSGTARVRCADASWPAVGARLQHQFGPGPIKIADHTTVLECEPPRRIVLAANARPLGEVRAELTVTSRGSGARVVLCETLVGGLGARFPLLGRAVQLLRNRRSLSRLIELAERDAT